MTPPPRAHTQSVGCWWPAAAPPPSPRSVRRRAATCSGACRPSCRRCRRPTPSSHRPSRRAGETSTESSRGAETPAGAQQMLRQAQTVGGACGGRGTGGCCSGAAPAFVPACRAGQHILHSLGGEKICEVSPPTRCSEEEGEEGGGGADHQPGQPHIELDLACGIFELHDAEAVAAAERSLAGGQASLAPPAAAQLSFSTGASLRCCVTVSRGCLAGRCCSPMCSPCPLPGREGALPAAQKRGVLPRGPAAACRMLMRAVLPAQGGLHIEEPSSSSSSSSDDELEDANDSGGVAGSGGAASCAADATRGARPAGRRRRRAGIEEL